MNELFSLFASSLISSTLLPGGSEIYLLWLIENSDESVALLIAVAATGNILGSMLTYVMGRWVSTRYPIRPLADSKKARVRRWLDRYGASVLLLAWLPILGDPLCFVAGWLRLSLLWSAVFISVGKVARYIAIAQIANFI